MKKLLLLLFSIFFFSSIALTQEKEKLSNYEKYRIQKEMEEHPTFNLPDTLYVVDTVYLEQENQESAIINNYYTIDYSLRHRLYFERYLGRWNHTSWYFDDLFIYGYSYTYYNWNYFAYNPWYFRYQPWSFRHHWNYWNTPWYYSSYYIYNSGYYYYADRNYYRNRYWNRRNSVIRHRNTPNAYRNYSSFNRSNSKTKVITQRKPVKVNRTAYLDKNTRRNISGINTKTKIVNNRRITTYKPTYSTVRVKRPTYNSTRRTTTSQNKSSYYNRPATVNRNPGTNRSSRYTQSSNSGSRSSGTRSSISRSSISRSSGGKSTSSKSSGSRRK